MRIAALAIVSGSGPRARLHRAIACFCRYRSGCCCGRDGGRAGLCGCGSGRFGERVRHSAEPRPTRRIHRAMVGATSRSPVPGRFTPTAQRGTVAIPLGSRGQLSASASAVMAKATLQLLAEARFTPTALRGTVAIPPDSPVQLSESASQQTGKDTVQFRVPAKSTPTALSSTGATRLDSRAPSSASPSRAMAQGTPRFPVRPKSTRTGQHEATATRTTILERHAVSR